MVSAGQGGSTTAPSLLLLQGASRRHPLRTNGRTRTTERERTHCEHNQHRGRGNVRAGDRAEFNEREEEGRLGVARQCRCLSGRRGSCSPRSRSWSVLALIDRWSAALHGGQRFFPLSLWCGQRDCVVLLCTKTRRTAWSCHRMTAAILHRRHCRRCCCSRVILTPPPSPRASLSRVVQNGCGHSQARQQQSPLSLSLHHPSSAAEVRSSTAHIPAARQVQRAAGTTDHRTRPCRPPPSLPRDPAFGCLVAAFCGARGGCAECGTELSAVCVCVCAVAVRVQMVKHNNIIPNQHFRKDWQRYVRTWFDQPVSRPIPALPPLPLLPPPPPLTSPPSSLLPYPCPLSGQEERASRFPSR